MLESNVGEEYAHGGIIGFTSGGNTPSSGELSGFSEPTPEQEVKEALRMAEQERIKKLAALEQKVAFLQSADAPQAQEAQMQLDALKEGMRPKPSPTDPNFRRQVDPRISGTPAVSPSTPLITSGTRPSSANVKAPANKDNAPMPAGLQGLVSSLATPGLDYQRKLLNQDENALAEAKEALYNKKVGARDLSIYDQMAEELRGRKERLNAPKAGYDATMELLEQIAAGGGRNWMEAGSRGVAGQRALQKSRLSEQDLLMEKILDLGAKKSDAQFAEKKGMFDLTQTERDRVIKEKSEAAKQLGLSEDETRKLIEQGIQKELDRKNELKKTGISAANRDDLLGRALLIKKDNPTISIEEAIKRAAVATYAGQAGVAEGKIDNEKEKRIAAIRKDYGTTMKFFKPDSPIYKQQLALMEKAIAEERGLPPEQGINALPSANSSGKVPPPPPGYKEK